MRFERPPDTPRDDDVRAALARVIASDDFRSSPQLTAFLTFVVAETLAGRGERIKGYTIAVEALGRDASFDPQIDPIVRVEATRLRRALERYYATAGRQDPVVIRMERGSYVPAFVHAPEAAARPVEPDLQDLGSRPGPVSSEPTTTVAPAPAPAPASGLGPSPPTGAVRPRRVPGWIRAAFVATLAASVVAVVAVIATRPPPPIVQRPPPASADPQTVALAERLATVPPSIEVREFVLLGRANQKVVTPQALQERLRDALARFDDLRVLASDTGTTRPDFTIAGWIDALDDLTATVSVRLVDIATGDVIWSRQFERLRSETETTVEEDITRQIATTIGQPYGVIQTQVSARVMAAGLNTARVACLVQSFNYWRTYAPETLTQSIECLEEALEADPSFATGHATLAQLYLEQWRRGIAPADGEAPTLDRALASARTAVALRPESARAHQALLDVHFHRREIEVALSHGERALAINPYDTDVIADLGARYVAIGRFDQGVRLLRQATALNPGRPAWVDFFLFLAAYMRGDAAAAGSHAALIRSDDYLLGLMARSIAAVQQNQPSRAAELVERMTVVEPGMVRNPREVLERFFPRPQIVERLLEGLGQAGLNRR